MLRLISNKAKVHFNTALELAERDRNEEAVAELQNALELDHSHVSSHVVQGTLYAKLGDLEKARACWREALSIDPRLEKAHDYLAKAEASLVAFPVFSKQRRVILALSTLLAVLLATLAVYAFYSPNRTGLQTAWNTYRSGNYDLALRQTDTFIREGEGEFREQAIVVREVIEAELAALLRQARERIEQDRIAEADRLLADLLRRRPPPAIRSAVHEMRVRILDQAQQRIAGEMEALKNRQADPEAVRQAIALYRSLSGIPPQDPVLLAADDALTSVTRTLRIEDVRIAFERREIDAWGFLDRMAALRGEYPADRALEEIIRRFAAPLEKQATDRLEAALKGAKAAEARQALEALQKLLAATRPTDAAARLAAWNTRFRAMETGVLLRQAQDALAGKRYETAVELAEALLRKAPAAEARSAAEALLEQAQPLLANERWLWINQRDWRYLEGVISPEDAERTIRIQPQVAKYLSRRAYPSAQDDLLLYLALSHRRLGRTDAMNQAFERILKEFPKTSSAETVKRFQASDARAKKDKEPEGKVGANSPQPPKAGPATPAAPAPKVREAKTAPAR